MGEGFYPERAEPFDVLAPLEEMAETARAYARGAKADNTNRAYAADWRHYLGWCARFGVEPLPPDPQAIGLYLAHCASTPSAGRTEPASVKTIERRLSGLVWGFNQRGQPLDRSDRHIQEVLAGIRRKHGRPPSRKEAVLGEDIIRMVDQLDRDTLSGLRDRAILLLGFAGGLRRSEIVGLDQGPKQTEEGRGWVEILEQGLLLHIQGKTGWREVEIGRGSSDLTCPVVALTTYLRLARIEHGPLFRRTSRDGRRIGLDRLSDRHVARLVKKTALAAGVRADLPEEERRRRFSGHSLRAGLATAAEADERHVQKQLGHASAEMTRKYQRQRERFRVNLTKAAGL
ncbi:site-specific integrase [Telmatospirillum sp. J64-1]|uniref:site-specific integrase n=1 Tax=Telmatospirillum sp. J64-1 TaxID=2502183 RepID=UPI00115D4F60|nr:site-specific integrase [Telmatospirillum sp. J64-1]